MSDRLNEKKSLARRNNGGFHFSSFTLENTQVFLILAMKDRVSIATTCHGVLECSQFFMIAAGMVTCLFEYPSSPVHQAIANADLCRLFIGIAMGLTAIALIYSPWGKQSGAHINPAITLTFYRLGKVKRQDALFYILFQCLGGITGVYVVVFLLRNIFTQPPINYIVTVPA